jgi:putative transposase
MAVRNVSYKYRLYPNVKQEILLAKTFGCVRYLWNQHVAIFNSYNKETNPFPIYPTTKEYRDKMPWMREVSFTAVQQRERDFDSFKKQFFNTGRKEKIGRPCFKKKGGEESFRLTSQVFRINNNKIHISKVGWVKIVIDRQIPDDAKILSATISKNLSGQYFASICTEHEIKPLNKTGYEVGIDVGLKEFLVQSDGIVIENPQFFRESQAKLKRAQQHFARKKKGSRRRRKCKLKVAKIYQKVTGRREWFLHNESTRIVRDYDVIAVETLNVIGMLKNHTLSKSIYDAAWGKFFIMLEYKAEWYGKQFIKINRFAPSSKTCSSCGWKNNELTLKDRVFTCPVCGLELDRDHNAAINIKALAVNSAIRTQSECKTSSDAVCGEAFSASSDFGLKA